MEVNVNSLMTAAQVSDRISSMSSFYNLDNDDFRRNLEIRLSKLRGLRAEFQSLEAQAYGKMGCSDLSVLQQRIDEINANGIRNFGARVLASVPVMKEATDSMLTEAQKVDIINQEINKALAGQPSAFSSGMEQLKQDAAEGMGATAVELILSNMQSQVQGLRVGGKNSKVSSGSFNKQFTVSGNQLKMNNISSAYKKETNLLVQMIRGNASQQYIGYDIKVQWDSRDSAPTMNYYPYYNLTPQQKTNALKDETTWMNFKRKISSLAPRYSSQIYTFMEQIGKQPFFAASPANIQGIMGELGAMVMLSVLAPGIPVTYTGDKLNQYESMRGQQLGVDVFLGDIGFQVKNYTGYGVGSQPTGIQLRGDYTLDNFVDKIEGASEDIRDLEVLNYFHIQVSSDFSGIRSMIDSLHTNLGYVYAGSIDSFMPFSQLVQLTQDGPVETQRNLFYLIGGTKIVPTSRIINAYCIQLERILDQVRNVREGVGSTFSVKSSYSGLTYADYVAGTTPEGYGYDSVAKAITMTYNINLHIPYLQDLINQI